ncbi:MAG: ABC transporter ATP-binding protein [Rhodospirillaceae bacterium]|nr:ABC transporter ATP-binding protein [Rhodospirillaceae bacterium]
MLEAEGIVAGYGDIVVVHGVSFAAAKGEITAFVGANGAGKTTLMRALAGVLPLRRGGIAFAGAAIGGLKAHARVESGIVLVPEGRLIFSHMSVEDNLRIGAINPRGRAQRAETLEQVYALFPRLAERRRQLGGTLSGGEQQMLAVGRGLMARPSVLLLDEPTLGLAPIMVRVIFDTLQRLRDDGLTVVLAEQDVRQTLGIADRAFVLENGRNVLDGPGAALLEDPRVKSAYLGL